MGPEPTLGGKQPPQPDAREAEARERAKADAAEAQPALERQKAEAAADEPAADGGALAADGSDGSGRPPLREVAEAQADRSGNPPVREITTKEGD
jgi:hypothetical protein